MIEFILTEANRPFSIAITAMLILGFLELLLAMGGFAWLVGWAGTRLTDWGVSAYRLVLGTASLGAIAVGTVWLLAS